MSPSSPPTYVAYLARACLHFCTYHAYLCLPTPPLLMLHTCTRACLHVCTYHAYFCQSSSISCLRLPHFCSLHVAPCSLLKPPSPCHIDSFALTTHIKLQLGFTHSHARQPSTHTKTEPYAPAHKKLFFLTKTSSWHPRSRTPTPLTPLPHPPKARPHQSLTRSRTSTSTSSGCSVVRLVAHPQVRPPTRHPASTTPPSPNSTSSATRHGYLCLAKKMQACTGRTCQPLRRSRTSTSRPTNSFKKLSSTTAGSMGTASATTSKTRTLLL
mmetsp:Transcript_1464/g.3280  ORF Transcript_1464/g.3280 Transcript_1464/m.3280 type:complete len:269 (-) Transcript_1464:787-1593(-)